MNGAETRLQNRLIELDRAIAENDAPRIDQILRELGSRNHADLRVRKLTVKALLAQNQLSKAFGLLSEMRRTAPDDEEIWLLSAYGESLRGNYEAAAHAASHPIRRGTKNVDAYLLLANALAALARHNEALEVLTRALAFQPASGELHLAHARTARAANRLSVALDSYSKALSINPSPDVQIEVAGVYQADNYPDRALLLLQSLEPQLNEGAKPHRQVAEALTALGRFEEAEAAWALALKHSPARNSILQMRSAAEISAGRFHIAEPILRELIERDDNVADSFYLLTRSRTMLAGDHDMIAKMAHWAASASTPLPQRSKALFALGKAFDDLGDFQRAMECLDSANQIDFDRYPLRRSYDASHASSYSDHLIRYFNSDRLQMRCEGAQESTLPLFVVGMVRSGTTLTETILGRHSLVDVRGEQSFWPQSAPEYLTITPEGCEVDMSRAIALARPYLDLIRNADSNSRYVVDKNPSNLQLGGLLHLVFPNAKFVHLQRNPLDTLISMWMTPFAPTVRCASNKQNLVSFYREHLKLARHFSRHLPTGTFFNVVYEELVTQPDSTVTGLQQFLGLPIQNLTRLSDNASRFVTTPSAFQVRQPIHSNSVGRWRNYLQRLDEFADLIYEDGTVSSTGRF